MEGSNMVVVKSEYKDLYTQEQLAEKLGVSVATVSRRIKDFNLEPVVARQAGRDTSVPAQYSMEQFLILQQQQQQLKIQNQKIEVADKIADKVVDTNQLAAGFVIDKALSAMPFNDLVIASKRLVDEWVARGVDTQHRIEQLEVKNAELEDKIVELELRLDECRAYASVKKCEKYLNKTFKWQALRAYSRENMLPIKKTFDQNYGEVNVYHHMAWKAVYNVDIALLKE